MKTTVRLILVLILASSIVSCENMRIWREMKAFMRSEIVLPEDLHHVCGRSMSTSSTFGDVPVLVIYHDSLECSSCQINHLFDNISLYEKADTSGFSVVTVFSPRQEEYDEVLTQLVNLGYPYPVYIDFSGSFRKGNSGSIPEDRKFHTFLMDRDRHPVFVGNPMLGDDLMKLFDKAVSGLQKSEN